MPQQSRSSKRERLYEHVTEILRGRSRMRKAELVHRLGR